MRIRTTLVLATAAAVLGSGAGSASAASLDPYDGRKPFRCKVQRVGTGVAFPDPGADPFCVRYNKRNQDITTLGVIGFLANEPARLGAAGGKCFYFQRDRWRGSIAPDGDGEIYHWKGGYFFDLAAGIVSGYAKRVRIAGDGGDGSHMENMPEQWRPYVHESGAGAMVRFDVPADPRCIARVDEPAEQEAVYRPWYLPIATG